MKNQKLKKLRKFGLIFFFSSLAFLIIVIILVSVSEDTETSKVKKSIESTELKKLETEFDKKRLQERVENQEKVLKLFKSDKEPTAIDAVWTAKSIFKVGVLNDSSNRDGYASYVCSVLYEYGFKGQNVWVQIIDYHKLIQNDKWIKLGQKMCN